MHDIKNTYITDTLYPSHFHRESMPVWIKNTLISCGFRSPDTKEGFNYLDLGCGDGINLIIAAATNPSGYFLGVDFNEKSILKAKKIKEILELKNIDFLCEKFSDFEKKSYFLSFEFIACHGVYSWIEEKERSSLLKIIDYFLKPGGALYLSYLTHPGCSSFISAQNYLYLLTKDFQISSSEKAQIGINDLIELSDLDIGYFKENPKIKKEINSLRNRDLNYLSHELVNQNWIPMHSSDVIDTLESIGVEFSASADVIENIDLFSLPKNSLEALEKLKKSDANTKLLESFKDLVRNQSQRKDIFTKKSEKSSRLNSHEYRELLLKQNVCLISNPFEHDYLNGGDLVLKTKIGEIEIDASLLYPILEKLSKSPSSYSEIATLPLYKSNPNIINIIFQIIIWSGFIHYRNDYVSDGKNDVLIEKLNLILKNLNVNLVEDKLISSIEIGSAYKIKY